LKFFSDIADFKILKKLVLIGFPILTIGFVFQLQVSVDRFIIHEIFTPVDLGNYTLAIQATTGLILISSIIDQQYYPILCRAYGRSNKKSDLKPLLKQQILTTLSLTIIVVIFCQIFITPFVSLALPKYFNGIPSARIALVGAIPLAITGALGTFLNSINKQKIYLFTQIAGVIIIIIIDIIVGLKFNELAWIAFGTSIGFLLYFLLLSAITIYFLNENKTGNKIHNGFE
jgi:O-antigen/teichoic acid export membrane protein